MNYLIEDPVFQLNSVKGTKETYLQNPYNDTIQILLILQQFYHAAFLIQVKNQRLLRMHRQ